MRWQLGEISFDIIAEDTNHPVATVSFATPGGEIRIIAELEEQGRTLRLLGLHIQGAQPTQSVPQTCGSWRTP